jgi:hypothetical protein
VALPGALAQQIADELLRGGTPSSPFADMDDAGRRRQRDDVRIDQVIDQQDLRLLSSLANSCPKTKKAPSRFRREDAFVQKPIR